MNYPILTPVPSHYRRVCVFDVETTGLIPKPNPACADPPRLEECPYITQFSFAVFNLNSNRIESMENAYIAIPEDIVISERITEITGITRDTLREKGEPIVSVLERFRQAYLKCDIVVAHNLSFDRSMVEIEIARNGCLSMQDLFTAELNTFHKIDLYCTMLATVDLCNFMTEYIPPTVGPFAKPRVYKKFPKLSELHQTLFGVIPENLHNAMIDAIVCLRCFMKIRCCVHIPDRSFDRMIRNAST